MRFIDVLNESNVKLRKSESTFLGRLENENVGNITFVGLGLLVGLRIQGVRLGATLLQSHHRECLVTNDVLTFVHTMHVSISVKKINSFLLPGHDPASLRKSSYFCKVIFTTTCPK